MGEGLDTSAGFWWWRSCVQEHYLSVLGTPVSNSGTPGVVVWCSRNTRGSVLVLQEHQR